MSAIRLSRRTLVTSVGILALLLATLAAAVTVLAVRVDGGSMAPTLGDGERVLLRPFSGGDTPARFAIVVTRFDERGPRVVKRVIALPGDRVRLAGTQIEVQPAGTGPWFAVDSPGWGGGWIATLPHCCRPDGRSAAEVTAQTVPPGMLFLLGDDPDASEDSRSFGWAPIQLLDGVVRWRLRAAVFPAGVGSEVRLRALP